MLQLFPKWKRLERTRGIEPLTLAWKAKGHPVKSAQIAGRFWFRADLHRYSSGLAEVSRLHRLPAGLDPPIPAGSSAILSGLRSGHDVAPLLAEQLRGACVAHPNEVCQMEGCGSPKPAPLIGIQSGLGELRSYKRSAAKSVLARLARNLNYGRIPYLACAALALTACAPHPRFITTYCLTKDQALPPEPPRVKSQLTGKADEDLRIVAGSAIRLRSWGEGLQHILEGCRDPNK